MCGFGVCEVIGGGGAETDGEVGGVEEDNDDDAWGEEKNDGWRWEVIGLEGGEGESLSTARGFVCVDVEEENGGSSMLDAEGLQMVNVSCRDLMVSIRETSVMRLFSSRGS